ncbi:MAG TPA: hypothetical protein VD833_16400 [Vicinamibacterales bacterium]|nr:hypothetical protein [Vicinamibacterales bacterium]
MRSLPMLVVFSSALSTAAHPGQGVAPAATVDVAVLINKVRAAARFDYELLEQFSYIEERRDLKFSKLGKVTVGPLRRFEVHPSSQPGRTWKRLIAIDGRPLDPSELAERDAEHARHVREREERLARESPSQRARRLEEEDNARREREAIVDDAFAVFVPTIIGREVVEGVPTLVIDLTPRQTARVGTREGRWMKAFRGRIWIAEADYEIAALELEAVRDVTIGWGFVGRVHEGSEFEFRRRRFEGVWLPAEVRFKGSGRTLLFRRFDVEAVTSYSGYRRRTRGQVLQ